MKSYLLLLIALIFTTYSKSQVHGDLVKFKTDVKITSHSLEFDQSQYTSKSKNIFAKYLISEFTYKVIFVTKDSITLKALRITPYTQEEITNYNNTHSNKLIDYSDLYNNKYYTITSADFTSYSTPQKPTQIDKQTVSFGILTLPYKIRPQKKFSFDMNFNLNTTVNIRLCRSSTYIQAGAGIGSVNLNSNNTTLRDTTVEKEIDVDVSAAALTFVAGLMYSKNEFQLGVYMGTDLINNQQYYNWESHGKMWFAIGIGYNIFKIEDNKTINPSQSDQR